MKTYTETTTITYWKELRTGCIYKYYGESKPYGADEGKWVLVTAWDFDNQFRR